MSYAKVAQMEVFQDLGAQGGGNNHSVPLEQAPTLEGELQLVGLEGAEILGHFAQGHPLCTQVTN